MASTATERGIIEPDKMYALGTFSRLSGLGKAALRAARAKGLKVRQVGRHRYIKGADFIEYVEQAGRVVSGDG